MESKDALNLGHMETVKYKHSPLLKAIQRDIRHMIDCLGAVQFRILPCYGEECRGRKKVIMLFMINPSLTPTIAVPHGCIRDEGPGYCL